MTTAWPAQAARLMEGLVAESDSAGGPAGGCSKEHVRRRRFSGSRGRQLEGTSAPTHRAGGGARKHLAERDT